MNNKGIPIKKVCKYKEPEKPTALSWEDIQSALKQGKKCRRQQWLNGWYIMQDKNGEIMFHFTDENDTQEEIFCYKYAVEFEQEIEEKDWVIINKKQMKVTVTRLTTWERVVNAARFTQRHEDLGKEPSSQFKKQMILSEHSPLRLLEFDIRMYDIPYYVMGHLVRHVHARPFVSTSRPDITHSGIARHDMPQDAPVNLQLSLNAQEIINISKLRLCTKADVKTRGIWNEVIWQLAALEPELAKACVPQCVYRGLCPEQKSCGRAFKTQRELYLEDFDR